METRYPIEVAFQKILPSIVQGIEALFEDTTASFRQAGFSQEQVNTFLKIVEDKAHHYRCMHSEEITRH